MTDTSGSATVHTVGTRVGEYELVHDLGTKGDTTAFLARSKGANGIVRVVVLEIVSDALASRAGGATAVTESAQNAIKVKSLNVVSPLDAKNDGGLAIVSDTVDGASLHEVLEAARLAGEKIGIDVALRIVVDTLAGLNAAHQNKPNAILHGGLTPERLTIASEGTTKVTDFALARWREESSRAPYALDAADAPSVANDVFAAGVIAWELITGKRLFGGDSPALSDRAAEIPAPSTVVEGVSAKLDAAVTKALSREASARYATAAEFSRAVESSGTKVALRSAVGALITKLLKEPLAQRRDLVRRLRTAGTAMSAASGFAAGIGAASASGGTPSPAGATPVRMPARPLPGPGASITPPGKPGEGLRKPTMIGMPKPATVEAVTADSSASDAAKDKETPAAVTPAAPTEAASKTETPSGESPAAPSASKFGAPLVAPSSASTAPKTLGVAPTKIAAAVTPKADSTMPLEVGDVVSVPPPTPDRTMNVDIAEVTELAASESPADGKFAKVVTPAAGAATPAVIPSATTTQPGVTATPPTPPAPSASAAAPAQVTPAAATPTAATAAAKDASATETKSGNESSATTAAATTAAATTAAATSAPSDVEVVRDSEIPIESYESLPPALQGDAAAVPPATTAKLSVPPAPAPTPTGEGFDDEDIKPKSKGPVSLPTQSLDSFDEPLDAGLQKSKTPLYAGIVVVACLLVGGITLAMRGGSSTSNTGSSPNTANATADAGTGSTATANNAAPDVSAAPPPVAQNTAAPSESEAGAGETPDANAVAANEPAADAGAAQPVANPTPPPPEPPPTVAQNEEPPPAPTPPLARTPPAARVTPPPPARTAHTAHPPPPATRAAPPARNPVVRAPPAVRTATRPPPASRTPAGHQPTPPAGGRHEFRPGGL